MYEKNKKKGGEQTKTKRRFFGHENNVRRTEQRERHYDKRYAVLLLCSCQNRQQWHE